MGAGVIFLLEAFCLTLEYYYEEKNQELYDEDSLNSLRIYREYALSRAGKVDVDLCSV